MTVTQEYMSPQWKTLWSRWGNVIYDRVGTIVSLILRTVGKEQTNIQYVYAIYHYY